MVNQRRKRPFKGPTPTGVFQTVDIGAGQADYMRRQARKFRNRSYAAVDPRYSEEYATETYSNLRRLAIQLPGGGVNAFAGSLSRTLAYMRKNNLKTRHFNVDFPYIENEREIRYTLRQVVQLAESIPQILEPRGKIFLTTDDEMWVDLATRIGKAYGLIVRQKQVPIGGPKAKPKTYSMQQMNANYPEMTHIWKVVIEYVPRKYHPRK